MAHDIPLKDIALQAGVGLATVDRVVHGRGGVRSQTERRVRQAIAELARAEVQPTRDRRRMLVDLVMDAPGRFAAAVRDAIEAVTPDLAQAALRVRFHLTELATAPEIAATLARIARRGSHGVILKAPDTPEIVAAVRVLAQGRIPVVTLVTDLPGAARIAYVGLDNPAAGALAAHLVARWMGGGRAAVLVALSSHRFLGEEQREIGFVARLRQDAPHLRPVRLDEGRGLDRATLALATAALAADPAIAAVYSIGGGNRALHDAFVAEGRTCRVFIGHDLDSDNRRLLRDGVVDAVLHHDLRADLAQACRALMQPGRAAPPLSAAAIITRFNMPPG